MTGRCGSRCSSATDNQPGFASDTYQAVRQSAAKPATPSSVNKFKAHLSVRKGQFVGIVNAGDTEIFQGNDPEGVFLRWDVALAPGDSGGTPSYESPNGAYMLFNARIER